MALSHASSPALQIAFYQLSFIKHSIFKEHRTLPPPPNAEC
jgi:hypothetical protein